MSEQKNTFCFLKGPVNCSSGRIQDCNMKRVTKCMLEEEKKEVGKDQAFCFLKGLVDCTKGRVQDCNIKRVTKCMLEEGSKK